MNDHGGPLQRAQARRLPGTGPIQQVAGHFGEGRPPPPPKHYAAASSGCEHDMIGLSNLLRAMWLRQIKLWGAGAGVLRF